jgi:hypothetical protein
MLTKKFKMTEDIACRVIQAVNPGLTCGLGKPKPGHMCVEAAVCYALREPHGEEPSCVDFLLREDKIILNDLECWESKKDRANALLKVSIMQLGTKGLPAMKRYKKVLSKWTEEIVIPKIIGMCEYAYGFYEALSVKVPNRVKRLELTIEALSGTNSPIHSLDSHADIIRYGNQLLDFIFFSLQQSPLPRRQLRSIALSTIEALENTLEELKTPGSEYTYLI